MATDRSPRPASPESADDDRLCGRRLHRVSNVARQYVPPMVINHAMGIRALQDYRNRKSEAIPYLEKALKAPSRPGREVADEGRREEARALLKEAR